MLRNPSPHLRTLWPWIHYVSVHCGDNVSVLVGLSIVWSLSIVAKVIYPGLVGLMVTRYNTQGSWLAGCDRGFLKIQATKYSILSLVHFFVSVPHASEGYRPVALHLEQTTTE